MDTDTEIQELLLAISQSLKDFTGGMISSSDARQRYTATRATCAAIEKRLKTAHSNRLLEGFCYRHNIDNFTLASGMYRYTVQGLQPFFYYGDTALTAAVSEILSNAAPTMTEKTIAILKPESHRVLPHTVVAYPVATAFDEMLIFTAVTSSRFFSEKRFLVTAERLSRLCIELVAKLHPVHIDYFSAIRHTIDNDITYRLNHGARLEAAYYVFPMLAKIFNHMGFDSLLEISSEITATLRAACRQNAGIHCVSLREYVTLETHAEGGANHRAKKRLDFVYKGITIPYQKKIIALEPADGPQPLWDIVYRFNMENNHSEQR